MTPNQRKYLSKIHKLGRILNDDEAFDFYTENIMKNDATCRVNQWRMGKDGKRGVTEDYALWELVTKARQWHKFTLGSLVLSGQLSVVLNIDHTCS